MDGSGLGLLEASLVHFGPDQVWGHLVDLLQNRLLHDLRQMRTDYDGSDLVEGDWALGIRLLQGDEPSHPQIFWYVAAVECVC